MKSADNSFDKHRGSSVTNIGGTGDFAGFSQLPEDGKTAIPGTALTAAYSANLPTGASSVGSISDPLDATAIITRSGGETVGVEVSAGSRGIAVVDALSGCVDNICLAGSQDGQDYLAVTDNVSLGNEYQTYGVSVTRYDLKELYSNDISSFCAGQSHEGKSGRQMV